jgi:hypothetical protein
MTCIRSFLIATTFIAALVLAVGGCATAQKGESGQPASPAGAEPGQAAKAAPVPLDVAYFLQRMVDLDWLAYHEPGVTCRQFSSYDRATRIDEKGNRINWEANGDAGQFIRTTPEEGSVMAEMTGPGCITQMWSANPGGTVRFWFDGEKEPSLVIPMVELMSDQGAPPFNEPFSYQARPAPSNTASNCYFPIPYAKSCKVAVVGASMYYHVDYITYPAGTPVVTFKLPLTDRQQKVAAEVAEWLRGHNRPSFAAVDGGKPKIVPPGREVTLLQTSTSKGPEIVNHLCVTPETPGEYALRKAILKIYWDGCEQPGVVAPLVDFFGTGWFPTSYWSMPSRIDKGGTMVSLWPMPFNKSVRITVTNLGSTQLELRAEMSANAPHTVTHLHSAGAPHTGDSASPMYFHAMYRREKLSTTFDYPFVQDLPGPGRYVGTLLNIDNPQPGWWGEGDEKVWVDGDTFPSWFGTGSEDYFNDAWGMHQHERPYEGCPLLQEPAGHHRKTSMYRWHILDSIPFEKQFTMTIENYYKHWGRVPSDYSSVTYYYDTKPAGASFFKPLTLADLLPCNFRPEGAIEAESLGFPAGQKRTMEDLAKVGLADGASGTGAVELCLPCEAGKSVPVQLPAVAPGAYRIHLYLLAAAAGPGLGITPPQQADVKFTSSKLPDRVAAGSSCQEIGMLIVTGGKTQPVSFGLRTAGDKPAVAYFDAVRLERAPSRGIEAEIANWTSPDHLVKFTPEFGDTGLSGWGRMRFDTMVTGGLACLPVNLKPGFYEISAGLGCGPDFGQLRIRYELYGKNLVTCDCYAEKPGQRLQCLGRIEVPKDQVLRNLTFMVSGKSAASKDTKITIDWIEIKPCRGLTGFEGEQMRVLKVEHGEVGPQEMGAAFSGNVHQWIRFNDVKGRVQLGFDVPKAGRYDVEMAFCKSWDYATFETLIDGKTIGQRIDAFCPNVVPSGPVKFGQLDLTSGPHVLEFRVVGKNPESKGYYMALDYLELLPAK